MTSSFQRTVEKIIAMVDQLQQTEIEMNGTSLATELWKYEYKISVPTEMFPQRPITAVVFARGNPWGEVYPVYFKPDGTPFIEWHTCKGYGYGCGDYKVLQGKSKHYVAPPSSK